MLGTASVGAALIVRDYLQENKLPGTVVLVGCPAEEGGSGKAYLARAGEFNNLDVAITWHPAAGYAVTTGSYQANCQAYFRFKGVSSHAAGAPHLGRSALDAVELMDVGTNYMHVIKSIIQEGQINLTILQFINAQSGRYAIDQRF